jgi:hypothetical protein
LCPVKGSKFFSGFWTGWMIEHSTKPNPTPKVQKSWMLITRSMSKIQKSWILKKVVATDCA